jgi:hypothetical protein
MTFELDLSRRSLFAGLGALIAAPAIVRAASLMPVRAIVPGRRNILTLNEISREAVRLWNNSDSFITKIPQWWYEDFASPRIGDKLRIRLPPTVTGATTEWTEQVYPIVHA